MSSLSRRTTIKAWLYAVSIQYFVVQVVVALRFSGGYSWANNTISDLGNTACGIYGGRLICSPLHGFMNASFILLGLTMAIGSWLFYRQQTQLASRIGFISLLIAGLGTIMVGLFPENSIGGLHALGAAMPFIVGNIGLIILGRSLPASKSFKIYTVTSGVVALVALILFSSQHYSGLGQGGMERLTAYPQTIWLVIYGIASLFGRHPS